MSIEATVSKWLIVPAAALAISLAALAQESPLPTEPAAPSVESPIVDPPDTEPQVPPQAVAQIRAAGAGGAKPGDLPKFADVAKDYQPVVSAADGKTPLYKLWTRKKDAQVLAELPRQFEKQLLFIAFTTAGGEETAGVQVGDMYAKWKRYDKRLALVEPNFAVRTTGDLESKKGHERVFTDRVILDVPIVAMGPGGGPVIDMDALLLGQGAKFFGPMLMGANPRLSTIAKAKAFPENVELAFELPAKGGRFTTVHYSFKVLPKSNGYKPRAADPRIGYFTTVHRDIGDAGADTQWVRYVTRWKLEKADPKLKMSPPKEPIIFYLEHTIPVRYRRWVRQAVLEWNLAFEKVGIVNAIEVYQQDANTGAHMEKDPEDARYNFLLWTNSNMGFAIGPSRVDPRTGQILDADIVMDEGFISSYATVWRKVVSEQAIEGFGPQTLAWLETRPQWDPRVRLAPPSQRSQVVAGIQQQRARGFARFAAHPAAFADPTLIGDDAFDGLRGRVSQVNGMCRLATAKAMDIALFRLSPDLFITLDDEDDEDGEDGDDGEKKGDVLDGLPDWFVGPLLREVLMHEVGHTLGLRHNFKASTIRSLETINDEGYRGKPQVGSVMDYNPVNINVDDGPAQGDFTTPSLGPYDYWAIEYGYTAAKDLKPVVARVAEGDLIYATDEDTWGPDPRARRFDYGKDPLNYADSQMRLVKKLRPQILEKMVKDGESWSKARDGYEMLLGRQMGAVSIAANWIGGSYVNRDHKGDPEGRDPVTPIEAERQRRALTFVIENALRDEAYGLSSELLAKMTVDKWWDDGGFGRIFEDESFPVHDRISGMQAAALTMILNPTTLNRVFDTEFRVPSTEDAVTVAEVMEDVAKAVWTELEDAPQKTYTARDPRVSSLRRNLQAEHIDRLIDLSLPNPGFGAVAKPVSNLSTAYLRRLQAGLDEARDSGGLDPYTLAHYGEASIRIGRALDAQYIYNMDDMGGGGGGMPFIFMRDDE